MSLPIATATFRTVDTHMRITVRLLAAFAILFATPSRTTAQERKGFWIGAGVVLGSAALRCNTCDDGRDASGGLNIRAGWTANERLLIGGEFNGVAMFGEADLLTPTGVLLEKDVPVTFFLYNLLGTVTFYPKASSGFFLKGGAGLSGVDIQIDYVTSYLTIPIGNGLGVLAGAGYDIRVGRRLRDTGGEFLVRPAWDGRRGVGRKAQVEAQCRRLDCGSHISLTSLASGGSESFNEPTTYRASLRTRSATPECGSQDDRRHR